MSLRWREIFNSNNPMEEKVEEIESLDPPESKEEPWCSTCLGFTDYRRKWDTVSRGDLDGGAYSEVLESPFACNAQVLCFSSPPAIDWSFDQPCDKFRVCLGDVVGLDAIRNQFGVSVWLWRVRSVLLPDQPHTSEIKARFGYLEKSSKGRKPKEIAPKTLGTGPDERILK